MKRALKISLAGTLVLGTTLVAALFSVLVWISATQTGTQFAWHHAQDFLPPNVEIQTLEGRFAGPLEIRGIKITHNAFELEIDTFDLKWHPWQLWSRALNIERIAFEGVRYTQLEKTAAKTGPKPSPPHLPEKIELPLGIEVHIDEASLDDFRFYSAPETATFEIFSARLKAGMDNEQIEISSLSVESSLFNVEGNALLKNHGDFPLQGELAWQVPVPDYPTLKGYTQLNGTLHDINISQSIAKPYDIQGTVLLHNPVENPAFEISLLINPLKLQALNEELPSMTTRMKITGEGTPRAITFNLDGWIEEADMGRVNTALAGGFENGTVTLDAFKIKVAQQPAQATARGHIDLNDSPALDLTLKWEQFQWPLQGDPVLTSPLGSLELSGTWEKIHAVLDVAVGDSGRIEGNAKRKNDVVDIALLWHDLQWPLRNPALKSSTGHITVGGRIDAYTFSTEADIEAPNHTNAEVLLEGQGDREALHMSQIQIHTLDGDIEGEAGLGWTPELDGHIRLSGRELNPAGIFPEWQGNLGFSLQAQAGLYAEHPYLQLEQFSAQGHLRDYDVSLDTAGSYADSTATLERLTLSSGASTLEMSGSVSDILEVQWEFQSNDLASLLPRATGRLRGSGSLSGPLKSPRIVAALDAQELGYQNYRLRSLILDADIDVAGNAQSRVLLTIDDANAAGVELRKIAFGAHGTPDAHTLTLEADTSRGEADIALLGELENAAQPERVWNFRLDEAELRYPGLDAWDLQKPSSGHISAHEALLSENCWESGDAQLCLNGWRTADKLEAEFTLSNLAFSYLSPYLPPDLDVQGSLSGHGMFTRAGENDPFADIALKSSPIRVLSRSKSTDEAENHLIIAFEPADFALHMEHGGIGTQIDIPLSPKDRITFKGNIAPGNATLMKRALKGEIHTNIKNLDFIADLSPEVQNLSGRLAGEMFLAGNLEAPEIHGELALLEGAAELDRPGLDLKDIQVKLSGKGTNHVHLDAHAASGEGELNIIGNSDLRGNADIEVKGENFRAVNTLEAQIDASPDLSIALHQNRLDVEGELVIPTARITLKTLPESAVKVSDDQVIIDSEEDTKEATPRGPEVYARVRTVLGDNVHFDGFGLKGRIQGGLLVIDRPGEPTTASGELNIKDGEYRAYGQGLVIQKGRILFPGGPIDQPGLDVRAIRRPREGITVGVQVRGSLREPEFNLFSDPGMTQGNQLSYLVLGRPLSGTSGSESSALSRVSLALGLKGGNAVAEKIGGSLGLDQFGLDQGEAGSDSNPENASFVIGKYLSPRLYVSYGLGLFNQTSTLQLHYTLSKHWKFMTESATEASGADVIYVIETGE